MEAKEREKSALDAIVRRPKITLHSFLMGQASDPVLAIAAMPAPTLLKPFVKTTRRRRGK